MEDEPRMPTYEYACRTCGEQFEVVQSFTDPPRTECPACGGPLRKVFHAVGIAFKGTGFYKTDNRSSGAGSSRPTDGSKGADKTTSTGAGAGAGGGSGADKGADKSSSSGSGSSRGTGGGGGGGGTAPSSKAAASS